MAKSVIKFWDKIVIVLLGVLGVFNSCKQPEEYGMPYAEYEIKGIVTDKETSNPIQNIQVIGQRDTIYTNAEGKYAFQFGCFPYEENIFHLKIEDIDGEANGGDFETKEVEVKFTQADQVEKGDGKWYDGKFAKTQNIELEKMPVPEYGIPHTTFKP